MPDGPAGFSALRRAGDVPDRLRAYWSCIGALRSFNRRTFLSEAVDWVYSDGARFIRPTQQRDEIAEFLAMVEPQRPRTLVEIGTASGGTLFLLSRVAAPDAMLVSIDLPGGRFGGGYGRWRAPLYRSFARPGQTIRLIRADSHGPETFRRLRAITGTRGLDVLFIDGDHTYEGVHRDFAMYGTLVNAGGWIGLHDILPDSSDASNEVHRCWREIRKCFPHREIIADCSGKYGIGLIRIGVSGSAGGRVIETAASGNPFAEMRS